MLASLLGILTIGSGIGLLAFSASLLSKAALQPPLADLAVAILCVRVFGIGRGIWRYLERLVSHDLTFRFLANLRIKFYQALVPLAPARLWTRPDARPEECTTGDLLSRFVADVEVLQDFSARTLTPWLVALGIGICMAFILQAYHMQLALAFLVLYVLAGGGIPLFSALLSWKLEKRLIGVRALLNTALVDCIQGLPDLLAFDRAESQLERVRLVNFQLIHLQTRQAQVNVLRETLNVLLTDGCVWLLLVLAIPLLRSGQIEGVHLASIVLAALGSFEAIGPLAAAAQRFGGCLEAAHRLTEIVGSRSTEPEPATAAPVPANFTLEVRNLSFRYTEDGPLVLDNISFVVPQGHCVAIVGPSGAGKSTLANLLFRFWDYQQGDILLGGFAVNTLPQEDLLNWIGAVEQQTHLFHTTVRENILLARPEATQEQIDQAAQQALIYEVIQALPRGYATPLGEQGFTLSGGERQRLALARTILKDAPLLLLDEPTAHLDPLTEQGVLRCLRTFMQGRTSILITHRLIGLEMADEILVMEQGRIKERGRHDELLQARGFYWKHWSLQDQLLSSDFVTR